MCESIPGARWDLWWVALRGAGRPRCSAAFFHNARVNGCLSIAPVHLHSSFTLVRRFSNRPEYNTFIAETAKMAPSLRQKRAEVGEGSIRRRAALPPAGKSKSELWMYLLLTVPKNAHSPQSTAWYLVFGRCHPVRSSCLSGACSNNSFCGA